MKLRHELHLAGAGALTGALLLGTAPAAAADDIRDRQWPLDSFGVEKIWKKSTGEGVTVAVIGTGVDGSHPDLKGQVLDGKDYTDPGGNGQNDVNGHGTRVASVIAGHGHGPGGEAGVMGLAPGVKILPVRFDAGGDEGGVSSSWDRAVKYAVDKGADVINISYAGSEVISEEAAVEYAIDHDVVVVAGSGNTGTKYRKYPAAYPGVVSVGGWDDTGKVWDGASWGSDITLIAPAVNVPVAAPHTEGGYLLSDGTSIATAYVSASAALVRAKYPDLTQGQVINRLIETAVPLKAPNGETPELPSEFFGYGVVSPNQALEPDVPNGPKAGPLAPPSKESTSGTSEDEKSPTAAGDAASDEEGWMHVFGPPIVLFGLVFLVLVGVVVVAIVLVRMKRKDEQGAAAGPGGPSGPGWGWHTVPPPYPGQQPHPQAGPHQLHPQAGHYAGPPTSAPPPPNRPPSR